MGPSWQSSRSVRSKDRPQASRTGVELTDIVNLLLVPVEVERQRELLLALVALERLFTAVQRQMSLQRKVPVEMSVADLAPELLRALGRARVP